MNLALKAEEVMWREDDIFTLADSACGFACNTHNQRAVSASCSIDYLAPAFVDDRLTAEASEVERVGQSATVKGTWV